MSILSGILIVVGTEALGSLLLTGSNRGIGGYVPNVVVKEDAEDELQITEHPVEQGANITDHAYKKQATLGVTYGWSQSAGSPDPSDVYQTLLGMQLNLSPMTVVTKNRTYSNMLIRRINKVTDADTENCLLVDIDLQEVIIVSTSSTPNASAQQGTVSVGNLANAGSPAAVSMINNAGTQQAQDVTSQYSSSQLQAAGATGP